MTISELDMALGWIQTKLKTNNLNNLSGIQSVITDYIKTGTDQSNNSIVMASPDSLSQFDYLQNEVELFNKYLNSDTSIVSPYPSNTILHDVSSGEISVILNAYYDLSLNTKQQLLKFSFMVKESYGSNYSSSDASFVSSTDNGATESSFAPVQFDISGLLYGNNSQQSTWFITKTKLRKENNSCLYLYNLLGIEDVEQGYFKSKAKTKIGKIYYDTDSDSNYSNNYNSYSKSCKVLTQLPENHDIDIGILDISGNGGFMLKLTSIKSVEKNKNNYTNITDSPTVNDLSDHPELFNDIYVKNYRFFGISNETTFVEFKNASYDIKQNMILQLTGETENDLYAIKT